MSSIARSTSMTGSQVTSWIRVMVVSIHYMPTNHTVPTMQHSLLESFRRSLVTMVFVRWRSSIAAVSWSTS